MASPRFPTGPIASEHGDVVAADFSSATTRLSPDDLASGFAPIEFLWRHWIPKGKVIVLAGPGRVGKSSVFTGLAVARALGLPRFLGIPIVAGATLFVTAEDTPIDYGRRICSWIDAFCDSAPTRETLRQVAQAITFIDLVGTDIRLVDRVKRDYEANAVHALGLAKKVKDLTPRPDLVVLETVSRLGGDESNQAHGALIAACEMIATECNVAIVLVSHTGKANARENAFDAYASRGGSALSDNARATITVGKMPTDVKQQEAVLGRKCLPEERRHLILNLSSSTFAPPQAPLLLKPRSVLDSLVLDLAETLTEAEIAGIHARKNAALAYAVSELSKTGPVAVSTIKKNFPLLGGAIAWRDVKDAIDDAVGDGVLAYDQQNDRGHRRLILGENKPKDNGNVVDIADYALTVDFGQGIAKKS